MFGAPKMFRPFKKKKSVQGAGSHRHRQQEMRDYDQKPLASKSFGAAGRSSFVFRSRDL